MPFDGSSKPPLIVRFVLGFVCVFLCPALKYHFSPLYKPLGGYALGKLRPAPVRGSHIPKSFLHGGGGDSVLPFLGGHGVATSPAPVLYGIVALSLCLIPAGENKLTLYRLANVLLPYRLERVRLARLFLELAGVVRYSPLHKVKDTAIKLLSVFVLEAFFYAPRFGVFVLLLRHNSGELFNIAVNVLG